MSLNPIGLIIAAIAALVAAFVYLWNNSEDFRNFWIGLWDKIKNAVLTAIDTVKTIISNIINFIKENWQAILLFLINPFAGLFKYAYDHFEWFRSFIDGIIQGIKDIFSTIAQWIYDNVFVPVMDFFQPVIEFFSTAFDNIVGFAQGCWEIIKRIWEVVSDWFDENVITPIVDFFTSLWKTVSGAASTAWGAIKKIWNVVSTWFNDTIITPVKNFFTGMWDSLKTGAKSAWEGIKSVFKHVADWFKDIFSKAWEKVKKVFSAGGKVFSGIKEGITDAFKTVVNTLIRSINKIIAIPFNAINKALEKVRDAEFLGIAPFKDKIKTFDVPQIPELARGGVLKKGQKGFLEGDGTEAVVPLEKNTGWLDEIANRLYNKMDLSKQLAMAGPQATTTVNNFYQTNNSPKALSRLEIYRQSKNLLRMKR